MGRHRRGGPCLFKVHAGCCWQCYLLFFGYIFLIVYKKSIPETEAKLRDFLGCDLNIDYYIEFGNVHRFGSRQNNTNGTEIRPRPIVARFLYYNDLAYQQCAFHFIPF
jgi:hypothetical protein